MIPGSLDLDVTLHLGTRARRVPLVALAAALHLPRETLRTALVGLVLASSSTGSTEIPDGEPTEGTIDRIGTFRDKQKGIGTFVTNEPNAARDVDPAACPYPLTAEFLAGLLQDEANLPALRVLVGQCTPDVLQAALDETLAVPDARVRKSRGAIFTFAVRRRQAGTRSFTPPSP